MELGWGGFVRTKLDMWQSRVENEHYSVSYFDHVSVFET